MGTDYNDTTTYTYSVKQDAYGWVVYHKANGEDVADMYYATEEVANGAAASLNMREAKRVADAKERIERFKNMFPTHSTPYYSITGYYGD